jgi:riboflavin biosynthesis pyrimidine reductase
VRAGLVDRLLLFVAPVIAGAGPRFLGALEEPVTLHALDAQPMGEDLLVSGYVNEP